MELRGSKAKEELKLLKLTLKANGLYESDMELEEMRDMMTALDRSMKDEDMDYAKAIAESELDFLPHLDSTHRSIATGVGNTSTLDSPVGAPVKFVVEAEVHHSLDWSPPGKEENNNNKPQQLTLITPKSSSTLGKSLEMETDESCTEFNSKREDSGINLSTFSSDVDMRSDGQREYSTEGANGDD